MDFLNRFTHAVKFLFKSEELSGKFDFLDGFRGSLATWVILHHLSTYMQLQCDYRYFDQTGYYIGVIGFFILSSFLLSYRLLVQLHDSHSETILSVLFLKYGIKRFFRIYLPFVVMVSLIKFVWPGFGGYNSYDSASWWDIIALKKPGSAHLWTIAPEIKYYFFIPIFTLISFKLKKFWLIYDLFLVISLYIVESRRLFKKLFPRMVNFNLVDGGHLFLTRFTVFYFGSIMALFFYQFKTSRYFKYAQNSFVKTLIAIFSVYVYIKGLKIWSPYYNNLSYENDTFNAGSYWGIFLLIMMIGAPNFFTNSFSFLRYAGRFSFGIYLFHPMCLHFIKIHLAPFKTSFELIFYAIFFSYLAGFLFYYLVENLFIKIANFLCKQIDSRFTRVFENLFEYFKFFILFIRNFLFNLFSKLRF